MKFYIFALSAEGQPQLRIEGKDRRIYDSQPTCSTYNRFVRLANSGNYVVKILMHHYGVAWEMWRETPKPLPKRQRCQFCGEQVLPDDIFCAHHRQKEDELEQWVREDESRHDFIRTGGN